MNEHNLIPGGYKLTVEEQSNGGKASAASRKKKKSMKQVMEMLLQMPADTMADYELLVDMGIDLSQLDPDTVNNMLVVNAALLRSAKSGDVQSIKELRSIIEDDAYLKHKIKYENSKLKLEKEKITKPAPVTADYKGIPASLIAPAFSQVLFDIADHEHTEYVFPGGRGSTKSTFVGINIIDQLMRNEDMHALALRQYSNTLKDSVYNQILWGISALGLDDDFDCIKSPLEITRKKTGQKIFFRGADDPGKVKSIKPDFGYIGLLWFEELDQFHGADEVRKIEQSAIRGGDTAYIFKSFNPPKSAMNWANEYIKIPKETRLVTVSDYLTVPKKWLGKPFLEEAEFLKETNPDAYANEYLGEANGSGGNIFENVVIREITDAEIASFDNIFNGVDWGYFPDKFAFMRVHYAAAQHTLYIWDEYTSNKQSNRQTADAILAKGITANDLITCDSAEPKSVGDYRSFGLCARPAEKGPDSRSYSYKWLQSLRQIVIDNKRCPVAAEEFLGKEYERDKDGNIISGYPDGSDHTIDAVRYATERKWRKRGQ